MLHQTSSANGNKSQVNVQNRFGENRRGMIRMAALAAVGGIAGFASVASAQFVWDDGASPDHNWNSPNNWTANSGFPAAGDSAQWNTGTTPATTTVNLSENEAASDLQVRDVAVTFNLNNF